MSLNVKNVNGRKYDYFQYVENGKTVQKYCGPSGSVKTRKAYLEMEKKYLDDRKKEIERRLEKNRKDSKRLDSQ